MAENKLVLMSFYPSLDFGKMMINYIIYITPAIVLIYRDIYSANTSRSFEALMESCLVVLIFAQYVGSRLFALLFRPNKIPISL